jgi:hypothetical protein
MHSSQNPTTPFRPYEPVYLPTPTSLPRIGTHFVPGIGDTTILSDEAKESIPFQDLSKLAKRMDWAVVKMTNVRSAWPN